GQGGPAAQIDARWAELMALAGQKPPAEYDLTYPLELLEQLAAFLHTTAQDMGLSAWCGPAAGSGLHVTTLLNAAWDKFHACPDGFAEYERCELAALRKELGLPSCEGSAEMPGS